MPEGNVGAALANASLAALRTLVASSSKSTDSQSNNSSDFRTANSGNTSKAATRTASSSCSNASRSKRCAGMSMDCGTVLSARTPSRCLRSTCSSFQRTSFSERLPSARDMASAASKALHGPWTGSYGTSLPEERPTRIGLPVRGSRATYFFAMGVPCGCTLPSIKKLWRSRLEKE